MNTNKTTFVAIIMIAAVGLVAASIGPTLVQQAYAPNGNCTSCASPFAPGQLATNSESPANAFAPGQVSTEVGGNCQSCANHFAPGHLKDEITVPT